MRFLDRLLGRQRRLETDGERLYQALLQQSRSPQFYGVGKVPDSYEGRIEILTLHMSPIMKRLGELGEQGQLLSQSIYDSMVEDFDIALREEGLTDSGVKRRIKPMVKLFYARLKAYDAFLERNDESDFRSGALTDISDTFLGSFKGYIRALREYFAPLDLGDIADSEIPFPDFK